MKTRASSTAFMRSAAWAVIAVFLLLFSPGLALAQTALDQSLAKVAFDQKPGAKLDLGLRFINEDGKSVSLGDCLAGKPGILVPGYYSCPMLCRASATGLVNALRDVSEKPGRDFRVIHFTIDPSESPALAAEKKRSYLHALGDKAASSGWSFLTGGKQALSTLADAVGFHYFYDPESKQYAHPSGLVFVSPSGKISGYMMGVVYPPADLERALALAGKGEAGGFVQQIVLRCFRYQPMNGRYSGAVLLAARVAGLLFILGLGTAITLSLRSNHRKQQAGIN